jgi:hypothetical protein
MGYILLFFVTILQNASFTLVSRARNSNSILFHGFASILSNGIWFIVVNQVVKHDEMLKTGLVYTTAAVIGSLGMHWLSMHKLEKLKYFKK